MDVVSTYKQASSSTTDQGKLVNLLYIEVLKKINKLKESIKKKDLIETAEVSKKIIELITELINSLEKDKEETIQMTSYLENLYLYQIKSITMAIVNKNPVELDIPFNVFTELKSAWNDICNANAAEKLTNNFKFD
ncbi:flagellar export chaperone FliS [bacterium]|jgi:flagellar biosynthetic protein FliS|nr:flagellar export chaperone FliS [bacterium]